MYLTPRLRLEMPRKVLSGNVSRANDCRAGWASYPVEVWKDLMSHRRGPKGVAGTKGWPPSGCAPVASIPSHASSSSASYTRSLRMIAA